MEQINRIGLGWMLLWIAIFLIAIANGVEIPEQLLVPVLPTLIIAMFLIMVGD